MFGHDGWLGFGGGFMWLFWILIIIVLVVVIKMVIGNSTGSSAPQNESPLDILKRRYALGEIDEEEFEKKHRELKL